MKITPLNLQGAFLIEREPFCDERGSFARQFCLQELSKYGIDFTIKQCNLSNNYKKGVLRGMHYHKLPYEEVKIVSCLQGAIYDVIVDLRKDSPTYLKWVAEELSAENNKMLYIPAGVAHGFQTLKDNTLIQYFCSAFFNQEYYSGVRYNDPAFNIKWPPCENLIMNERDKNYALWQ